MTEYTALTDEQIYKLFEFTEKHCVRHYDLQMELVDHLADAVTAKMNEDGHPLSFDEALAIVYAGFGVMGFTPIIASRQKALLSWTNKEKMRLFKEYFGWPKAALTALLFTVFGMAPQLLPTFWQKVLLDICTASFVGWEITELVEINKKHKRQKQKLLLTENTYRAPGAAGILITIFCCFFHGLDWFDGGSAFNTNRFYAYSGIGIALFILSLSFVNFTANIHAFARRQYPEAFKA